MDGATRLQSLPNLFSDDVLLRQYYPELISDADYLPPGRTDFIEQYEAAKDLTVLRLKQDQLIEDEGQVIDINEVAVAATYAAAFLILNPLRSDEVNAEKADNAQRNMTRELNRVRLDLDFDNDGIVSDFEEDSGNVVVFR